MKYELILDDADRDMASGKPWMVNLFDADGEVLSVGIGQTASAAMRDLADSMDRELDEELLS